MLIGLEIVWIIALFYRKGVAFSDYQYSGPLNRWSPEPGQPFEARHVIGWFTGLLIGLMRIFKAKDKRARAIRNLLLIFFFPIILILFIVMSYEGIVPWEISAHILGSGFMVVAFIFVIVYINASAEPSTFMIKLIGISLGTTLIVLGFASDVALLVKDSEYEKRRLADVDQYQRVVLKNDFLIVPEHVIFILSSPLNNNKWLGADTIVFSKTLRSRLGLQKKGTKYKKTIYPSPTKPPERYPYRDAIARSMIRRAPIFTFITISFKMIRSTRLDLITGITGRRFTAQMPGFS